MANRQKRLERAAAQLQQTKTLATQLQSKKRKRKLGLLPLIEQLCQGLSDSELLKNEQWSKRSNDMIRQQFLQLPSGKKDFFIALIRHSKVVFDQQAHYLLFISLLHKFPSHIRSLSSWKTPKSKSSETIAKSLFLHLFVSYRLPKVVLYHLPKILFVKGLKSWEGKLLRGMAKGKGLHKIAGLPRLGCNSKMNFHLYQAPEKYTLLQALAWAKLKAMKADGRISNIIARKVFKEDFAHWPEWGDRFIGFVQRNPTISSMQANELLSFILYQKERKYEMSLPNTSYKIEIEPLFPAFELKGRTVASAFRYVAQWKAYLQLTKESGTIGNLPISSTAAFIYRTPSKRCYIFRQIITIKDLVTEGKSMNHCVASYNKSCLKKLSSIWSVQLRFPKGLNKKMLTIELDEASKTIVQIKGLCNRNPSNEELVVVKAWAAKEELELDKFYIREN